MNKKITKKARSLILSYDKQGWNPTQYEFDKINQIGIFSFMHENGNVMNILVDYFNNKILVYINNKLKDSIIL